MYTVHARSLNDIQFVHLSQIAAKSGFLNSLIRKNVSQKTRKWEGDKKGGTLVLVCVAHI